MRTKEGSSDYRYFTEPDLVPMAFDEAWIEQARAAVPELPAARRSRYALLGVEPRTGEILAAADPEIRALFEAAVAGGCDPRMASNWTTGEVTGWLRREQKMLSTTGLDGSGLAELMGMIGSGRLSTSAAKNVLDGVLRGEGSPETVAVSRDLVQITDTEAIEAAVDEALASNPDAIDRLRAGEEKVIGFLVGQVMKVSQGKADPQMVNRVVRDRLG